ncbi:MAG TPA: class I SAM-dependent methyltransferase [Steroidobacteraceae bacterium]|jgi:SAM-dependent methyltransferase|nr:class I SAM-dependent methyltransferase [Steroidobacteraceae bacterium]
MTIFNSYAAYYDLFYADKDYKTESAFVLSNLLRYSSALSDILELGCGTGIHAVALATAGYSVTGVDISKEMLAYANRRRDDTNPEVKAKVSFSQGDIRNLELSLAFDAAISLFHVMSYQTTERDIAATISGTRHRLKPGSPFVFDFWYGPAVVAVGPSARRKIVENGLYRVVREAQPTWDRHKQTVQVDYHITVVEKRTGLTQEIEERHPVRYFFTDDLESQLEDGGFRMIKCAEWLTDKPATPESFSAYILAIAE